MPQPPGIIDRVNYVVEFWEDPCAAPWTVYAETALPALGTAGLAFIEPSPTDVLRAYVKPRGARSAGRFGGFLKGGEAAEREALIPDTSELIGERIPFKARFDAPVLAERFKYFWIIDGAIQRVLWYYTIADIVSEFLFEWTTLINESKACSIDRGGSALLTRESQFIFFTGVKHPIEPMTVEKSWGAVHGLVDGTIIFEDEPGLITGGCAVHGTPGVTLITVLLWDYTANEAAEEHTTTWPAPNPGAVEFVFKTTAKANHIYGIQVIYQGTIEQTGVFISNAALNGFGMEMQNTAIPK